MELTPKQQREVLNVKMAMESYWDNIKFRKGWETPLFTKEEVDHLLQEAAEIVVRIRTDIDEQDPSFKIRQLDGDVREYLWSLTSHPKRFPERFVRKLVHAAFQNGNGYVEGLTKQKIDDKIDQIRSQKEQSGEKAPLTEQIKHRLATTTQLLNDIVLSDTSKEFIEINQVQLRQILASLSSIRHSMQEIETRREEQALLGPAAQPLQSGSDETSDSESEKTDASTEPEKVSDQPRENNAKNPQALAEGSALRKTDGCMLAIQRVAEEVDQLKTEVKELQSAAENLEFQKEYDDKEINEMNKKCLKVTEELMRDLLKLDELVSSDEKSRNHRKFHVKNIQGLLNDVDGIKQKLHTFIGEMAKQRKAREEQEKKAKEEQERKAKEEQEQKRQEQEKKSSQEKSQSIVPEQKSPIVLAENIPEEKNVSENSKSEENPGKVWRAMKFEPKFEVKELQDNFLITSYIPGMKDEDVKVSLSPNDTLQISGYREPSPEEISLLHKKIAQIRRRENISQKEVPDSQMLLRLGAGRYGTFEENYRLRPAVMNISEISASYEGGLLKIVIPKKRQQLVAPRDFSRFGGFPSFMNDRDLWW